MARPFLLVPGAYRLQAGLGVCPKPVKPGGSGGRRHQAAGQGRGLPKKGVNFPSCCDKWPVPFTHRRAPGQTGSLASGESSGSGERGARGGDRTGHWAIYPPSPRGWPGTGARCGAGERGLGGRTEPIASFCRRWGGRSEHLKFQACQLKLQEPRGSRAGCRVLQSRVSSGVYQVFPEICISPRVFAVTGLDIRPPKSAQISRYFARRGEECPPVCPGITRSRTPKIGPVIERVSYVGISVQGPWAPSPPSPVPGAARLCPLTRGGLGSAPAALRNPGSGSRLATVPKQDGTPAGHTARLIVFK